MPLTHDMGLIGFHIFMFANRMHCHLMPTELFVRRPLLWLHARLAQARHHPVLAQLRLPALPEGAGRAPDRRPGSVRRCACIFNGAEPISVELCDEFLDRLAPAKLAAQRDVPGVRAGGSLAGRELPAARARRLQTLRIEPPPHGRRRAGRSPLQRRHPDALSLDRRGQGHSLQPGAHRRRRRCSRCPTSRDRPHPHRRRQRHARLLTRIRRRTPRPSRPTAGCAPATWA